MSTITMKLVMSTQTIKYEKERQKKIMIFYDEEHEKNTRNCLISCARKCPI